MNGVSYFVRVRSGSCTPDSDLPLDSEFEADPDLFLELEDDSEDDLLDEVRHETRF